MSVVLDLEKAVELGAEVPTAGVFRGETVITTRSGGKSNWVFVKFADNHIYEGQEFEVPREALIVLD